MNTYKKRPSKALIQQQLDDANVLLEHYRESYPLRCAELKAQDQRIAELEGENNDQALTILHHEAQIEHLSEQLDAEPTTADDANKPAKLQDLW